MDCFATVDSMYFKRNVLLAQFWIINVLFIKQKKTFGFPLAAPLLDAYYLFYIQLFEETDITKESKSKVQGSGGHWWERLQSKYNWHFKGMSSCVQDEKSRRHALETPYFPAYKSVETQRGVCWLTPSTPLSGFILTLE